ncbi:DUF6907 domain-containing protein [Streptomyces sp. NPDC056543]|uniref:DUF6907 domain-containing protein n=1 Tax=unclassified Streptomyces TaxID=2593676 RepID=UPI00369505D1
MSERTVTVFTTDHGEVTIPEPAWCQARHEWEAYREDIEHQGAELVATIPTLCHGLVEVMGVSLVQRPFSPTEPRVHAVLNASEDWHALSAAGLDVAAGILVEHASAIRKLARELSVMEDGR